MSATQLRYHLVSLQCRISGPGSACFHRAHLRSLTPLPQEELLALKRTLAELGSIGRNLNQIARAANQGQLVVSAGRDDLTAMLRICGTLHDSLKRVLPANLKSWEQGSP